MAGLYVTSLTAGEGRTAVAAALTVLLRARGSQAMYAKPISIVGTEGQTQFEDADLAFCSAQGLAGDAAPLYTTGAALAGGLGTAAKDVRAALAKLPPGRTAVIDGLPAAGAIAKASRELAEAADARVVVVARYRRGMDLDAIAALRDVFGDRSVGAILNAVPAAGRREAEAAAAALTTLGVPVLALVPEDRRLLGVSVSAYGERLGARVVVNEDRCDTLIEAVLVGANSLDPGDLYTARRSNKAFVTRGDRPDLQWSALNEQTRCLILTKNQEPIPYILNKAEEEGVPILVTPGSTLETIEAIQGFIMAPAFHHPEKLERFTILLGEALDLAALPV